jgi:hypothetical protein
MRCCEKLVVARHCTVSEALALGNYGGVFESQDWGGAIEGYKVDIAKANSYGIKLETVAQWCESSILAGRDNCAFDACYRCAS